MTELPPEAAVDWETIRKGGYDVPMREAPKTVLDIGAHMGMFSAWARVKWPGARIHAYEPRDENADVFADNFAGINNVTLTRSGVRGFSGASPFWRGRNTLCGSFVDRDGDQAIATHIDASELDSAEFVKIDTEGSELEILQRLDLTETKAIVLEAHTHADSVAIRKLALAKGFVIHDCRRNEADCDTIKLVRRDQIGARGQHVFIAVPIYNQVCFEFMACYTRLAVDGKFSMTLRPMCGDSLVARARNTLTAEFLKSDATDLLFIDSDLVFSAHHIERILSHDADVVGGFYPKKQEGPLSWVCNTHLHDTTPDEYGLQEVRYIGTGFMRVRRCVFEKMIKAYGDALNYRPDQRPDETEYDFWSCGVYQSPDGFRRYLSEDWFFCQRWLDLGGKVMADTKTILKHVGQAVYPLMTQVPEITRPIQDAVPNSTDHSA